MRSFLFAAIIFWLSTPLSADTTPPCATKTSYSFGMVPVASANLFTVWSEKINRELAKSSCYQLIFQSAGDFNRYIDKAKSNAFDILAVPAHLASYLISNHGYQSMAFLVWESKYLYVTRRDSKLSTLQQFEGIKLALPDPLAETSILVKADLKQLNKPVQYQHYQNYNLVLHALMDSSVDAAVMISPFYNGYKARPHIENSTVVIHSMPFPSHGMLLAAPYITTDQRDTLLTNLASLKSGSGFLWDSFQPALPEQVKELHQKQKNSVDALEKMLDTY